mgnify:CR=1 FL=1
MPFPGHAMERMTIDVVTGERGELLLLLEGGRGVDALVPAFAETLHLLLVQLGGLGFMTTSQELGCDCLGEIVYVDAVIHDSAGEPRTIRDAICIHE